MCLCVCVCVCICVFLAIATVKATVIFISATSGIFTFLTTWIRTRMYAGRVFSFAAISPEAIRTSKLNRSSRRMAAHA